MPTHKNISVCFTDRAYRLSHMKTPRGYGSWAFKVWATDLPLLWAPSGTFSEAKAWARTKVREMQAAGQIPASVKSVTLDAQP